jgi:hypothetical protein
MPPQLLVESVQVPGGGKGGTEVRQVRTDLILRPFSPVVGAVARRPFPFEPLCPVPQARRPLEERGVRLRVGADGGEDPLPDLRVIGRLLDGPPHGPKPSESLPEQGCRST